MMQENQSGKRNLRYHPELIALYNSTLLQSVLIGNILLGIIYISMLHTLIPSILLFIWVSYLLFVSLYRLYLMRYFRLYKRDGRIANRYVHYIILSTALNGFLWGLATILTSLYASSDYLSLMTIMSIGIAAGAMISLSPIYKSYIAYLIMMLGPLIMMQEKITALLIILFMAFVIVGGYKHYIKLRETIKLKHKLKDLNTNLEGEVKKRTLELEDLNHSLEDRVKEEIEKNRAKDQQLVQQSRMAQMGEMISMIAHQWRQPLGAIAASSIDLKMKMAFASFDLDKKEGQEACSTYFDEQLTHIETYVQSLTTTIDDFRNFYKPNKEKKRITINEPIQKSLHIIEAAAKANGIKVISNFESQKELALFDSELMQVFLNILKNAQDNFLEKNIQDATIMIKTEDTQEGIVVEICDNGGGIPEAILEKIFDPYFSTKDEKNGTGLGLYMSKTIIEEHHKGKLSIENRNDGACFILSIYEDVR